MGVNYFLWLNFTLMICFPNCKINLGLFVTGKRADGYHNLETVFYPIAPRHLSPAERTDIDNRYATVLNDVLEITLAQETRLHLSGLAVNGNLEDNLVWKAYDLLKVQYGERITPINIHLHKATPMGAGLGGGSADGAYMLRLMNDFFALGLSKEVLAEYSLQLGSDCPFFIYNTPQFATGRGEVMQDVSVDLKGYEIKIVTPGLHVSTRDVFAQINPRTAPFDLRQISTLPVSDWKHHISNDFETTVFAVHPQLAAIKQQLYDEGALYASMSGTGSAVYGIFSI
jgi:4-diphosphocytidyl-2-C-methyl-D-erythritol kinase